MISSGRPDDGIEGLRFWPLPGWASGVYEGPPLLWTRLVVVSELPVTRETLLLRLLGAGAVLRRAIAELEALEPDAAERMLALPILVRLRLTVPADPAKQTSDDQEFLMDTQDVVEALRQEGRREGLVEGERKALLRQLRRRFGAQVDSEVERRLAVASSEQVEHWIDQVLTATSLAELWAS